MRADVFSTIVDPTNTPQIQNRFQTTFFANGDTLCQDRSDDHGDQNDKPADSVGLFS